MTDINKLEDKEAALLLINLITAKIFFFFPKSIVATSGQAAWISVVFMSLFAIVFFCIFSRIYEKNGSPDLFDVAYSAAGNPGKRGIGILFYLLFIFNAAGVTADCAEAVKTVLLPLTPIRLIIIILAGVSAVGAGRGIASCGRIHSLFLPLSGTVFVLLLLFLIPNMRSFNLFPILGKGTQNILSASLKKSSFFFDIIALAFLFPHLKNKAHARRIGLFSISVSSVAILLLLLAFLLCFPSSAAEEFTLPFYQMTRLIKGGGFFQRLESFFEFILVISVFLYLSAYLYIACDVLSRGFSLKYPLRMIPVSGLILAGASRTSIDLGFHSMPSDILFILVILFILPIMFFIYVKKQTKQKNTGHTLLSKSRKGH